MDSTGRLLTLRFCSVIEEMYYLQVGNSVGISIALL